MSAPYLIYESLRLSGNWPNPFTVNFTATESSITYQGNAVTTFQVVASGPTSLAFKNQTTHFSYVTNASLTYLNNASQISRMAVAQTAGVSILRAVTKLGSWIQTGSLSTLHAVTKFISGIQTGSWNTLRALSISRTTTTNINLILNKVTSIVRPFTQAETYISAMGQQRVLTYIQGNSFSTLKLTAKFALYVQGQILSAGRPAAIANTISFVITQGSNYFTSSAITKSLLYAQNQVYITLKAITTNKSWLQSSLSISVNNSFRRLFVTQSSSYSRLNSINIIRLISQTTQLTIQQVRLVILFVTQGQQLSAARAIINSFFSGQNTLLRFVKTISWTRSISLVENISQRFVIQLQPYNITQSLVLIYFAANVQHLLKLVFSNTATLLSPSKAITKAVQLWNESESFIIIPIGEHFVTLAFTAATAISLLRAPIKQILLTITTSLTRTIALSKIFLLPQINQTIFGKSTVHLLNITEGTIAIISKSAGYVRSIFVSNVSQILLQRQSGKLKLITAASLFSFKPSSFTKGLGFPIIQTSSFIKTIIRVPLIFTSSSVNNLSKTFSRIFTLDPIINSTALTTFKARLLTLTASVSPIASVQKTISWIASIKHVVESKLFLPQTFIVDFKAVVTQITTTIGDYLVWQDQKIYALEEWYTMGVVDGQMGNAPRSDLVNQPTKFQQLYMDGWMAGNHFRIMRSQS